MSLFASVLKDIFFPKYCFGCSKLGVYLCLSCRSRLISLDRDVCSYCDKASWFGLTHPLCKRKNGLDGCKSLFRYNGLVQKIIKQIKYRLVKEATREFISAIPAEQKEQLFTYKQWSKEFCFFPVPLHKNRLRARGFNQAEAMARFFSDMLGFPLIDNLIVRVKDTKPQVEFARPKDRYNNVHGAFSLAKDVHPDKIKGKHFIIFDDVWTTGWTIKEAAKILKTHGAAKAFALTMAR